MSEKIACSKKDFGIVFLLVFCNWLRAKKNNAIDLPNGWYTNVFNQFIVFYGCYFLALFAFLAFSNGCIQAHTVKSTRTLFFRLYTQAESARGLITIKPYWISTHSKRTRCADRMKQRCATRTHGTIQTRIHTHTRKRAQVVCGVIVAYVSTRIRFNDVLIW